MGLLGFFSPPKRSDSVFGDLVYRRRAWHGELSIAELHADNIPLEIQTSKDSDLSAFHPILNGLRESIRTIKEEVADESFTTCAMYIREDGNAGNFTDADYAQHPPVTSAADIWRVLKPFRFSHDLRLRWPRFALHAKAPAANGADIPPTAGYART